MVSFLLGMGKDFKNPPSIQPNRHRVKAIPLSLTRKITDASLSSLAPLSKRGNSAETYKPTLLLPLPAHHLVLLLICYNFSMPLWFLSKSGLTDPRESPQGGRKSNVTFLIGDSQPFTA